MKLNRRNVLQLLGLAGASYAGASFLGASPVRAGNPVVPKRIVFFYTEHGTLKQYNDDGTIKPFWSPSVNGAPDALTIQKPWSTSDFTLRDLHAPLLPYQKQLLMLDGIDMTSAMVDPTGTNGHLGGSTHALIGANRQTGVIAGGVSIDQLIAQKLNTPAPITVLPSLEVFIDTRGHWGGSSESTPIYSGPGLPIQMSADAPGIYDRLFPNGPLGSTAAEKAKEAKLLALQTTSIEAAYARYKNVSSRASLLDRTRLDAHADALRDLEKRLALASTTSCTPPDKAITDGELIGGNGITDELAYTTNADILMRLVQTSLACDLTRVASVYAPTAPDGLTGYTSVSGTTDIHDMIHKTNGAGQPLLDNPEAIALMKKFHTYNASLFVKFLDLLAAVPEADGTTLLDNTLVVWCGELAGGDHSLDHIPYVLAGGMGGAVKTGRYVRYPRVADKMAWPTYSHGPAHNDLLVSLANMMDVPIKTFGNPDVCTGPLAGLTG